MENFVYVIEDHRSSHAAIVDPGWEGDRIIAFTQKNNLHITDVLLTHSHYDHVNGLARIVERCHPHIHLSVSEAEFWGPVLPQEILHEDGDQIELGKTKIEVLHTPGHTPGSVCYYLDGHVLTGDTLFVFGCGRCDLKGGNADFMHQSLKRLAQQLPPETVVHPGHHYAEQWTSTIAEELEGNPFMHFDTDQDFLEYRMYQHDRERDAPYTPVKKK